MTYMLESKNQVIEKNKTDSDITVIFVIDISGSMCVTHPVKGQVKLKNDPMLELRRISG